jgi:autophagy-related protein 101
VDESVVKDALRAVLHTIIFSRALGPVIPEPVDMSPSSSLAAITYLKCGLASVDHAIEGALRQFKEGLQMVGPALFRGHLLVSFFERKRNTTMFGFGSKEEKVVWEQWVIPVLMGRASSVSEPSEPQSGDSEGRDVTLGELAQQFIGRMAMQ